MVAQWFSIFNIGIPKYFKYSNYFENVEGKVREKVLGVKLLECQELPNESKKRTLQDIGDTALFLCGTGSYHLIQHW